MRIIRRTFANLPGSTLLLGRAGENNVTRLELDVSKEQSEFKDASFELVLKTPASEDPYPVVVEVTNNKLTYNFSGSDLAESGYGQLEALVVGSEGELLKSATAKIKINPSIIPNTYPGPLQKVIEDLKEAIGELEAKGIKTVTVLPDDPDDDEIVYLNASDSGFYRWDGSDWVRLTDDGEGLEALANIVSDMRDDIPSAEKQASWDSAVAYKHTHSNKDVLDTIVDGKVSAWDDAASKKHTHANKALLDEITTDDAYGWSDAANKRHIHTNKEVIDGFDRRNDGALTFFGEQIPFVQNPDATTLGFKTYTELYVRDGFTTDATTILDVPLYVGGRILDGIICELYESKDADPNFKNGIRLSEVRDDYGVPMLSVLVRVDNVNYTYYPRDFDTHGGTIQAGWHPSEPTITSFTPDRFWFDGVSYRNLNNLSEEAKSVLYSLSQCINESEESFGTIIVSEDSVTRFEGVIKPNRKYMFVTGDNCTFDGFEDVEFSETDAQFVIYLTCTADVDFSFTSNVYFVNGTAPNTDTGSHKIIGTWLKEEEVWAIGGIDYSEVS